MIESLFASLSYWISSRVSNQVCTIIFYQPKLPDKVMKLKKTKKGV